MTPKKTFNFDQLQQLEIGLDGQIMPRMRDLRYDATLRGSLLTLLYPEIRVASVLVPVEVLDEVQESRIRNTMSNFIYKGVRYKIIGASGSAKEGLVYFADEKHERLLAARFQNRPQDAITYLGTLTSNCQVVADLEDARVLVVRDTHLGTNDCGGWIRNSIAAAHLNLNPGTFSQFRIAFENTQGKGTFKVMGDEVADLLNTDFILPESSVKPRLRVLDKIHNPLDHGTRFRGRVVVGIRAVARELEFESSYTLTQHAPGESVLTEILPETISKVDQVSQTVADGNYTQLLALIGHNLELAQPEQEVGTVEGLLLADKSGHIVKHPWVNSQLDKLLTRWTYKACTGGAFRLPAFALAHDGYLIAHNGKVYHSADWIPISKGISLLQSDRGLCVRYPIRMFQDLLPIEHMPVQEITARLRDDLTRQGCQDPAAVAEAVLSQLLMRGAYILHSKKAECNGGDFDFDLVAVIESTRFPLWVAERFAWTNEIELTKTKAKKVNHPWWNIVHVARKAMGNQIGSITDLITSCRAEGREDLAIGLVKQLQNALDSLKHGVEVEQEIIAEVRKVVDTAPWLSLKHVKKVSDLKMHLDVKETDKIGILYNHVRPHFDELMTTVAPLDTFIGLIQGENVTDKMLQECHYVNGAWGVVVAEMVRRKTELKGSLDKAKSEWEAAKKNTDKNLRKQKLFAKRQAQAAFNVHEERSQEDMTMIISFLKMWAQNKTQNRRAWAQALNSIVCQGKGKSTGSLTYLTFPQEIAASLAEITGGEKVRLYSPRMIEGWVRIDQHGRTYLVEVIQQNLLETFLFRYKDGKFSLNATISAEEVAQPQQSEVNTAPAAGSPDPEGLGHELVDDVAFQIEHNAEGESVPF